MQPTAPRSRTISKDLEKISNDLERSQTESKRRTCRNPTDGATCVVTVVMMHVSTIAIAVAYVLRTLSAYLQ